MSFPRADRFSDKIIPAPSPADYNLRSPLDKGSMSIFKNARFPDHQTLREDSGLNCFKMNNALSKSSLYMGCCKKFKDSELNRNDLRKSSDNIIKSKACCHDKPNSSKQLNTKNVNSSRGSDFDFSFEMHEEFFDDDYDTFITKEELEELMELEEYEFSEIWKRFQSICSKGDLSKDTTEPSDFENTLTTLTDEEDVRFASSTESLRKPMQVKILIKNEKRDFNVDYRLHNSKQRSMTDERDSQLSSSTESLDIAMGKRNALKKEKNHYNEGYRKQQTNKRSKTFEKKTSGCENSKSKRNVDLSVVSDKIILENVIREVIEKLRKEFKKEVCKKVENKLGKLSELIRSIHMEAEEQIEEKCEAAVDSLILKINNVNIEK